MAGRCPVCGRSLLQPMTEACLRAQGEPTDLTSHLGERPTMVEVHAFAHRLLSERLRAAREGRPRPVFFEDGTPDSTAGAR